MSPALRPSLASWSIKRSDNGFTLIELVVVIALVSIMLVFSFPRFEAMLSNETRKTSQWILLNVPEYRNRAVSENQTYTLHADMGENLLWFSGSNMTDEQRESAMSQGHSLSEAFFIADVTYANGESISSGDAPVTLYPKGYSSNAILHMEDGGGENYSFIFEPFLNQVELVNGYADFED